MQWLTGNCVPVRHSIPIPRPPGESGNIQRFLHRALVGRLVVCLLALAYGATPAVAATLPAGFAETQIGGTWNEAVGLLFEDNGRMYVWERAGRVWIVEDGVKRSAPLIDLSEEVGGWRDYGLLGFALDPNFRSNGFIYLMYVVDRHHLLNFGTSRYSPTANEYFAATIGRITRYTARAADGFTSVDPASRRVLLGETKETGFPILHQSHGVGSLVMGTDGTLLASCGDGACYNHTDVGSDSDTYYAQGLSDGIIRDKENVGAYRAQLVDCLNGKVIRIDSATGDGVAGNPFFDAANPRAAKSRVWALGLRNPCRMTLRPGTGSHERSDVNPGALYIGDVGWNTWEDLHVATGPGRNFGWPAFEGIDVQTKYFNSNVPNLDARNPLYPAGGCPQFFFFRDLIKQGTSVAANQPPFATPCDASVRIPSSIPQFLHSPPVIDWQHGTTRARTWLYSANGVATSINVGATGSPVTGPQFPGNCSIGGVWYHGGDFPAQYQNTYFHADYGAKWIRSFSFDANDRPVAVRDFLTDGGGVVAVATHPVDGGLYYISWASTLRRISYSAGGNQPPTARISSDKQYGASPLAIQFTGSGSYDPEGKVLSYRWNFGDGTAESTAADPSHSFVPGSGAPRKYDVTLTVTDPAGATAQASKVISVNNTPPSVTITSPVDGSKYVMSGDTTYNLRATVLDAEHPDAQLRYEWQTILHHNNHEHADPADTNHLASTVISPVGCDGNTYYYRIVLTVTDPAGLSAQHEVRILPDCPKQTPSIVWVNPAPIVAGTALGGSQLNAAADVPGTFVYQPPAGTILPLGNGQVLSTTFTPADTASYTTATKNVSINVVKPTVNSMLIATSSVWKYLDNGSNQGTGWRAIGFNDGVWASGPAPLGYGDGDEATVVSFGPSSSAKYVTTYFRRAFNLNNAGSFTGLTLRLQRDDGAVVYLNGTEVYRGNLPSGAISSTTVASAAVGGADEAAFLSTGVSPALLVNGVNVVAVEVHQSGATSSDVSFALELTGTGTPTTTPTISWNNPARIAAGTPLGSVHLNATASVPGTFVYHPPPGTVLAAGNGQVLNCTFTPTDGTRYTTAGKSVSINVAGPVTTTNTLIAAGASWKYLDRGSNQGTAWRAVGFNDAGWASGPAPLGYGDGDEATVVGFGPSSGAKYATTYFRRAFNLNNAGSFTGLTLRLQRDDGAVVYLNGNEVFRSNLPAGAVSYSTLASTVVSGANETAFYATTISPTLLANGANVVAVEIHQANASSSDISFDLELKGVVTTTSLAALAAPTRAAIGPLKLAWIGREADGRVTLSVEGFADRQCQIETSIDLVNWSKVNGVEESNGVLSFGEDPGTADTHRFYRAVAEP